MDDFRAANRTAAMATKLQLFVDTAPHSRPPSSSGGSRGGSTCGSGGSSFAGAGGLQQMHSTPSMQSQPSTPSGVSPHLLLAGSGTCIASLAGTAAAAAAAQPPGVALGGYTGSFAGAAAAAAAPAAPGDLSGLLSRLLAPAGAGQGGSSFGGNSSGVGEAFATLLPIGGTAAAAAGCWGP